MIRIHNQHPTLSQNNQILLLIWLIFKDDQTFITEISRNARKVTIKYDITEVRFNKNYFAVKTI